MAGNQLSDLFTRNVLLLPATPFFFSTSSASLSSSSNPPLPSISTAEHGVPSPPSPLDMVAQLLPSLSVCTTVPIASVTFPTGWEVRGKIFPKYTNTTSLPLYLNYTVHYPTYGEHDSGRFYMQSSLGHILGITHIPHIPLSSSVTGPTKGSAAIPSSVSASSSSSSPVYPSAFYVGSSSSESSYPSEALYFDSERTYRMFYDEAIQVLNRHALPSSSPPHPRLLIVVSNTDDDAIAYLNSNRTNPSLHFVGLHTVHDLNQQFLDGTLTPNDLATLRAKDNALIKDLRTLTSSMAYDIIQQLMEDARITAAGGNESLVHGTTGMDPSLTVNSSASSTAPVSIATTFGSFTLASCFTGVRGGGIDVALTTGLSSVTLAMGGAKRRLQTRLLRRRGDAALLAGSPNDALEMYDKAAKSGRAATDEIGLALIAEGKAAALLTKYIQEHSTSTVSSTCSLTDVPFLPEIASSLREAVVHIDNACNQADIRSAFEGIYGLAVTLRLRLCHYLFTSPTLPKMIMNNAVLRGDVPIDSALALSNEAFRPFYQGTIGNVKNKERTFSEEWMQNLRNFTEPFNWGFSTTASPSVTGIDRGSSNGKTSFTATIASQLSSGSISGGSSTPSSTTLSPVYPEILEVFATASLQCALVRPTTHQIRCLLGTAGIAYRANIKRKGEVLLLRAARLLRSIQHTIPTEWHNQLVTTSLDSSSAHNDPSGSSGTDAGGFRPNSLPDSDSPRKINRVGDTMNNDTDYRSPSSPSLSHRGGCIYGAIFSIQPVITPPVRTVSSDFTATKNMRTYLPSFSSVWPWPWMHSSCMLASRTLPLAMRSCAPTQLAGCLCIAAGGGAELLNPYLSDERNNTSTVPNSNYHRSPVSVITRKDFCRLAAVDFYMCGDLPASLAMVSSGMLTKTDEGKTVTPLNALSLPISSEILHSVSLNDRSMMTDTKEKMINTNTTVHGSSSVASMRFQASQGTSHLLTSILTDVSSSFTLLNSLWHRQSMLSVVTLHSGTYVPSVLLSTVLYGFRLGPLTTWARLRACMHVLGSLGTVTEHAGNHLFDPHYSCNFVPSVHPDNREDTSVSLSFLPTNLRQEYGHRQILFDSIHDILGGKHSMCIGSITKSIYILTHTLSISQGSGIQRSNTLMNAEFGNADGPDDGNEKRTNDDEHQVMEMSFSDFAGDNTDTLGNTLSGAAFIASSENTAITVPGNTFPSLNIASNSSPNGGINESSAIILWHTRDLTKTMGEYLLSAGDYGSIDKVAGQVDEELLRQKEIFERSLTRTNASTIEKSSNRTTFDRRDDNVRNEERRNTTLPSSGITTKDKPIVQQIHTIIMPTVYGTSWIDPIYEQ